MRAAVARALFIGMLLSCGAAQADVYVLVEPSGKVRYSNVPDDPRYRLYMRDKGTAGADARRVRVTLDRRLPGGGFPVRPTLQDRPFHADVLAAAKAYDLDPALIHAVIAVESDYRPTAVSPKGAIGLMQVMPATGTRFGASVEQLRTPATNIRIGTRYLAWLLERFKGDVELALAGYNAGESTVTRHGNRIPPYAETRAYVPRVLNLYDQLRGRHYASAGR